MGCEGWGYNRVFFHFLLDRDVNIVKYLAGEYDVG